MRLFILHRATQFRHLAQKHYKHVSIITEHHRSFEVKLKFTTISLNTSCRLQNGGILPEWCWDNKKRPALATNGYKQQCNNIIHDCPISWHIEQTFSTSAKANDIGSSCIFAHVHGTVPGSKLSHANTNASSPTRHHRSVRCNSLCYILLVSLVAAASFPSAT